MIKSNTIKPLAFAAALAFGAGPLAGCETAAVLLLNAVPLTELAPQGDKLYVAGELNSKTFKQMKRMVQANPQINTLVLTAMPGSLDDEVTFAMGRWLREQKINTHLTAQSVIASGAVDLYLSGVERTMERGAKLGVHSWSDGNKEASYFPKTSDEHKLNRDYIVDLGVDEAFYWFTIYEAPADSIHWMSEAEVTKFTLTTAPITATDTSQGIPFTDFTELREDLLSNG